MQRTEDPRSLVLKGWQTQIWNLAWPKCYIGWYLGYLLHSIQYLPKNSWNLKEWYVMQDLRFSWQFCWGCKCCAMWHCHRVSCSECFEGTVVLQNVGIHLSSNTASHPRRSESSVVSRLNLASIDCMFLVYSVVFSEGFIFILTYIVRISIVANLWCPGRNTILCSVHSEDGR